ncbi:MAG: phosphatase, partial [Desulfitobacterium sp.]|nr:phosphatase [Desulfitobacterium sp.]
GIEENTHAFIKAMKNPFTEIMAHPGRLEFPLDLEKIAYMSNKLNVPLELNNSSLCPEKGAAWDNCRILAKAIVKYGGLVSLGSDAHFWDRVGDFSNCLQLVQESGIKEEQILNTSLTKLEDYLKRRHELRPTN